VAALRNARLIDEAGHWSGGVDRVWFLGDLTDRGPDGIKVVDLVIRLAEEAREAGGMVDTLLGNHELLLLGSREFGDTPVDDIMRSFEACWLRNGGKDPDLAGLTGAHVDWLTHRPVAVLVDDHLLLHADATTYRHYGDTVDDANKAVADVLSGRDPLAWWRCFRALTRRYDFRGEEGPSIARQLLEVYGGRRIVHGHSTIPEQRDVSPSEVSGAYVYADGLVVNLDGGLYAGGPCLVTELPLPE